MQNDDQSGKRFRFSGVWLIPGTSDFDQRIIDTVAKALPEARLVFRKLDPRELWIQVGRPQEATR